ncbi:putative membrane protein [Treponema primitia ZAS-2]|uniref:Putative membrane protein n=1 Tax=Treponema primitia (strain ATCC BAA-887 / DSM 12427 / ZAS-2) TaxID=545694 RepID=F5YMS3_TREPZ|nr:RnfABCDGE type electron transport complex subunit D [Treponema primitia]AEF86502.1 putative membrane protein [Treponema primitia ZAS-2]
MSKITPWFRSLFPQPFQKPQINLARSTSARMWLVSICAGFTILQSSLTDGFSSMFIALFAVLGALMAELLISHVSGRTIPGAVFQDGSAVASALILTLLLPNHIHPFLAFLGALFAMLVVKHSFGGLGTNWVNPALGGWLFVRFGWPGAFNAALEGSSLGVLTNSLNAGAAHGSPLEIINAGAEIFAPGTLDSILTPFLNKTIFSITGAELPGGYIDLLVYSGPGIIADRGVLALLLGTIIISASQVSHAWVPLSFLGIFGLLIRLFGGLPFGDLRGNGDILFGFFTGGTLVAAFLLAADPSTGPKSHIGVLAASVLAGFFSFVFRYRGVEPYGAFFATLLINALIPLLRYFETRRLYLHDGTSDLGFSRRSSGEIPPGEDRL